MKFFNKKISLLFISLSMIFTFTQFYSIAADTNMDPYDLNMKIGSDRQTIYAIWDYMWPTGGKDSNGKEFRTAVKFNLFDAKDKKNPIYSITLDSSGSNGSYSLPMSFDVSNFLNGGCPDYEKAGLSIKDSYLTFSVQIAKIVEGESEELISNDVMWEDTYHYVRDSKNKITKGENSKWEQGSSKSLTFTSNAKYEDFESVYVDAKEIGKDCYTVKSGSTIVELKPEFISTLSNGKHSISINSKTGSASTSFEVVNDTSSNKSDNTFDDDSKQNDKISEDESKSGNKYLKTGENSTAYVIVLSFIAISALSIFFLYRQKSKK